MKETQDAELQSYFRERYNRARFIMDHVAKRRETLVQLTRILVTRQQAYLQGKGHLKPLTMSEVAEELGVHTSTVSRAVKGKYIQFPKKTMAMKDLFSVAVTIGAGAEAERDMNAQEIKERIRRMIQEEDKEHPFSDQAIADLLKKEGIRISRRAVAKYREEMMIKGSFQRKL